MALLTGCAGLAGRNTAVRPLAERLKAQYPDLAEGRFAIIADFEQPEQMAIVHASGSADSSAALDLTGGIPATGGRCLRVRLAAPQDALVFSNPSEAGSEEWVLKRDWREYDLLLANVYSPQSNVELELTLAAGIPARRDSRQAGEAPGRAPVVSAVSPMLLAAGWNLLRLDLTEAGEKLAMDDVRALRLTLPKIAAPLDLRIDDVILVSNRKDLFGNSSATGGELYIQQRGRRWNIGAGGRFELGFSQGQIVAWYDLAGDPNRLRNLVGGGALGPMPIVLPDSPDGDFRGVQQFVDLGQTVVARQRVLEMSPVRVMLESDWRFVPVGSVPTPEAPYHRWTYCIYPSGHMYVGLECTTKTAQWSAGEMGVALTTLDVPETEVYVHSTAQLDDPDDLRQTSFAAISPGGAERPGLLFVPSDGRVAPQVTAIHNAAERQLYVIASGGQVQAPVQEWDFLVSVWPPGNTGPQQRVQRALAYAGAPPIEMAIGTLVTDHPGDPDHDGFDERTGCFVIAPDENRARVYVHARTRPLDAPVFCVTGIQGRQPAVYVDQAILDSRRMTFDSDGNLVFQVPGTLAQRHLVEVYLRPPAANAAGKPPASEPQP
ncbi:MAG TPA: hypothetical protein VGM03_07325 [Phycisphaerae bacterium]